MHGAIHNRRKFFPIGSSCRRISGRLLLLICVGSAIQPAVWELTAGLEVQTSRPDAAATVALVGVAGGTAAAVWAERLGALLAAAAERAALGAVEGAALAGVAVPPVGVWVGRVGALPVAAAGWVASSSARGAGLVGVAGEAVAGVWVEHFWVLLFERIRGWSRCKFPAW